MQTKELVSAATASAVPALNDGLLKEEAAKLAGCSVRGIERRAAAGLIRSWPLPKGPGERAARVVYSRADIERLPELPRGENRAKMVATHSQTIVNGAAPPGYGFPNAAALLPMFSPPAKPWLSIAEISKFSGLPATYWRERAPELSRARLAINVGRGKRPRWRVLIVAVFAV